jgi:hypothetical protein
MRRDFGKPHRTACRARWPKIALSATACGSGVTKLTLGSPWQLQSDEEDFTHSANASVEVGDPVALARYLDPRLRTLRDDQRLRLPRMRIGRANVTITVVAQSGRIRSIVISLRRTGIKSRAAIDSARRAARRQHRGTSRPMSPRTTRPGARGEGTPRSVAVGK